MPPILGVSPQLAALPIGDIKMARYRIAAISMDEEDGKEEHIGLLKLDDDTEIDVPEGVRFLADPKNSLYVLEGGKEVEVYVVKASPKYLKTYADGLLTNNLLSLPRI
ncbi:DUF3892 domain-containing protein [Chromobacterium haemolyticum]|uniref:DUF3892 domain-containing protein n=1 Tax=Chromobacterium haemolyticum TaxID=394935 RepID=UPI001B3BD3AF|nr:DUF3892 domain-containing protein [Chromobacterium haemolyticum]